MSEQRFRRILTVLFVTGLVLTVLHAAYAIWAYQNASIIYFIAKEWW